MLRMVRNIIATLCLLSIFLPATSISGMRRAEHENARNDYQLIPDAYFREAFEDYLSRHWAKTGLDIQVSKFKVLGNRSFPPGDLNIKLFARDKGKLDGHVRLLALVSLNGEAKGRVGLSGWVDVFGPIICASRNLRKGDILDMDDVFIERGNISRLSSHVLTKKSSVIGLMIKHNVKKGLPLKAWMLQKVPVTDRGDVVTIVAESGSLKVTVPGRVLEKGYMGQTIIVQNIMSKKRLYARVIASDAVKVDF